MEKCGKTPEAKRREHSQGRELRLLAWSAWTASASATAASFKNWKSQTRPSMLNHNRQLIRAKRKNTHTHTKTETHTLTNNQRIELWHLEGRSSDVAETLSFTVEEVRRSCATAHLRRYTAGRKSYESYRRLKPRWRGRQRGFKLGPNNGNLTLGPSPEFHNLFRAFKSTKACNSKHSCK